MSLKICRKCKSAKGEAAFGSDTSRHDGLCTVCKDCRKPTRLVVTADGKLHHETISDEPLDSPLARTTWIDDPRLTQEQNDHYIFRAKLRFDCMGRKDRAWMLMAFETTHDAFKTRAREAGDRLNPPGGPDLRPDSCWGPLRKDIAKKLGIGAEKDLKPEEE